MHVTRVGQTIGRADALRHVHTDTLGIAFFYEGGQIELPIDNVIGAALLEHVATHAQGGTFDSIPTAIGEDVEPNGFGSLQISYARYANKYFQMGIAPTFSFMTGEDEDGDPKIDVQVSGSVFFNLNLATASKTIPYITMPLHFYCIVVVYMNKRFIHINVRG